MTEREVEIFEILKKNPLISQEELAEQLMISRSGAATHIHNLMKKGYIKGKGYIINQDNFVSVIGGNNLDILGIPNDRLITNNSNSGKIYYSLGGAGRNIALALTKLNVQNYFISVYGKDLNGKKFILDCRENNMDISCCEKIDGEHTSSFMYIDNSKGIKIVGINDMEIYDRMTPTFLSKYLDKINSSQYCILDTNIPEESFKYLYENVDVPIIIKTTSINKDIRILQENMKIDVLVISPKDLEVLLNYYGKKLVDIASAIHFLLTKNISHIVVYSVHDGLYFEDTDHKIHIKKPLTDITNTNGAIATLTSVIVWGLQKKLTWNKIIRYGYTSISICSKSKLPISPKLNVENLVDEERKIFEPTY